MEYFGNSMLGKIR